MQDPLCLPTQPGPPVVYSTLYASTNSAAERQQPLFTQPLIWGIVIGCSDERHMRFSGDNILWVCAYMSFQPLPENSERPFALHFHDGGDGNMYFSWKWVLDLILDGSFFPSSVEVTSFFRNIRLRRLGSLTASTHSHSLRCLCPHTAYLLRADTRFQAATIKFTAARRLPLTYPPPRRAYGKANWPAEARREAPIGQFTI